MLFRKLSLLLVVVTLLLSACSNNPTNTEENEPSKEATENLNTSGMPIVKEPITLNFFNGKAPTTADDWNDVLIWNTYKDMTNINVKWEMVPTEGLEEKRNLALASGNLPDAFHTAGIPSLDLLKYGEQGVFIKLNDLIEEHAPNLKKLFEEYPEIEKGLTFPDGSIYSLPTIYSPEFQSVLVGSKLWIRQDWLDALEMDMPETTEEFYQYLKAVKENDPNGNGQADEIPYGATSLYGLTSWLEGSFGIGNRGSRHPYIDMDPEKNELRFFPISDGYKEMLQYINKLFSEKLIQQNIYSIEPNQYYATGSEGMYGSTVLTSTETLFGEAGKSYVGAPALAGPYDELIFTQIGSPLVNTGGFAITSENEHPAATVRWLDYFYSDEGAKLFFMGIEGETFEETPDGEVKYLDKITNSADGLTMEQELAKYLTWLGGGYPGIVKKEFFKGAESLPSSIEATEKVKPYLIDEVWPAFTHTVEESREMTALSADIEKYVTEMQDKFISGEVPFSEWDKYVETIEKMGLEDYMAIKQAAYERFMNN
jgi:putative aldouronate transport system substrate-binding protein